MANAAGPGNGECARLWPPAPRHNVAAMTPDIAQIDFHAAQALLEWQMELGADEAIGEVPVNRYEVAVQAPKPAPAMPVPVVADAVDPVAWWNVPGYFLEDRPPPNSPDRRQRGCTRPRRRC